MLEFKTKIIYRNYKAVNPGYWTVIFFKFVIFLLFTSMFITGLFLFQIDSDSEEESDFQVTIAQYLAEERDINGNTSGSERMEEQDTIGNTSGSERVEERNTIGFEGMLQQTFLETKLYMVTKSDL